MSTTPIAYGRALYYPHINLTDEGWLKAAALYYKGINRIIPAENYPIADTELIHRLNEDEEFVRNILPQDTDRVADDFLAFAEKYLCDKNKRDALLKRLSLTIPASSSYSIHMAKMSHALRQELPRLGLAAKNDPNNDNSEWFDFDPLVGAVYMTFLANRLAELDMLPIVTDDTIFQPLINAAQLDNFSSKTDIAQTLATMVIQSVVPKDIQNVPISTIINFRRKYEDERHQFYYEVNKLVKGLELVDRPSVLEDCLNERQRDIAIAVGNLEKSLHGIKIQTRNLLLAVSIPSFAISMGAGVAISALVAVVLSKIQGQRIESLKSRSASPYSYVLSLKDNLDKETLLAELMHGKILI